MSIDKMATAAMLVLSLGACTTMQHARDRIVKRPPHCADQAVQIYFEPQSADVTKEGRAVIVAAAHGVGRCKVAKVDVVGLADATGGADANLELSKRRAQSVTAALAAAGLPAADFNLSAAGQAGAVTPEGKDRPLRRRVDVVLHLTPA
jgi:peptidoglycan-associated lipoprotein